MQWTQSIIRQPKRLSSYTNYTTRTQDWILNLITGESEFEMIEDYQEKAEAIANYLGQFPFRSLF